MKNLLKAILIWPSNNVITFIWHSNNGITFEPNSGNFLKSGKMTISELLKGK